MFDANMRHLPEGKEFFAEVHYVEGSSRLKQLGVVGGDVLFCKMLGGGSENPLVKFVTKTGIPFTMKNWDGCEEDDEDFYLVYSGNRDGSGFICDEWKGKAESLSIELGFGSFE